MRIDSLIDSLEVSPSTDGLVLVEITNGDDVFSEELTPGQARQLAGYLLALCEKHLVEAEETEA